jgi:hypothetical protein
VYKPSHLAFLTYHNVFWPVVLQLRAFHHMEAALMQSIEVQQSINSRTPSNVNNRTSQQIWHYHVTSRNPLSDCSGINRFKTHVLLAYPHTAVPQRLSASRGQQPNNPTFLSLPDLSTSELWVHLSLTANRSVSSLRVGLNISRRAGVAL